MNVGPVRAAIADTLQNATGWNCTPWAVAAPTPPGMQVLGPAAEYDLAFSRGLDRWQVIVQAFVSLAEGDLQMQIDLDGLAQPDTGVKAALEADRTLGGLVQNIRVTDCGRPAIYTPAGGSPMLVLEFTAEVYARG